MNRPDIANISDALRAIPDDGEFDATAAGLLAALGYRSGRTLAGQTGAVEDFLRQFGGGHADTAGERALRDAARSVRLLFQFTEGEIPQAGTGRLFATDDAAGGGFGGGNARSFLFAAVDLYADGYPRGRYAAFTREINKRFQSPVVTLFRTAAGRVSLGFVHRRPNRINAELDVLGRVSLVREIDPANPHRAHLDILGELSLPERLGWMDAHVQPRSFDGLLAAWLDALDTEALNRRFYADLFQWFQRAAATAQFPAAGPRTLPPEEHLIRLITRLLFAWFIKEKGLVAEELFNETRIAELLQDYDRADGDSYYRAVLQNLFFATLNTEIGRRGFSSRDNSTHRDFDRYRYRREIADADALLGLFAQTPFINGGLFDCLDSFESVGAGGWRIDCFTDNPQQRRGYSIPNRLFFGPRPDPAGGPAAAAQAGLIDLFHRYKFTVEENTPAEEEVALDPELLGKVFENLLAYYVPETRETARKLTGSYYTPRPVVDYMVDEALLGALARRTAEAAADGPPDGPADEWTERLRRLLDYAAPDYLDDTGDGAGDFSAAQRESLVRAIAGLKILDPAVGSGAFPMGALHKLTLALRRLDPDNRLWERVQREQAVSRSAGAYEKAGEQAARDAELQEISANFQRYRDSDFGRKLYLIQHSIYGVDIQPIATQIAKLRFFISLAIEQQPGGDPAANYGIQPLPNLETRFVAADALLALERPRQLSLGQTESALRLERELAANRERHFHAAHRQAKRDCREEDARLRRQLAGELETAGFPAASAQQIAAWEPFDQNAPAAGWFDPEYMFGVAEGFDVVIGNPPYIQLQKDGGKLGQRYQGAGFATFARTGDIYQLFYERGVRLLAPESGLLAYITSNSWLKAEYGQSTRRWFAESHTPLRLLEMGKDVFENAIVDTAILTVRSGQAGEESCRAVDLDRLVGQGFPPAENLWADFIPAAEKPWSILSGIERSIMDKMESAGTPLKEWGVNINYGIKTGYNAAFIIDEHTRDRLIAADPKSAEIIKPVLRGRDIRRWRAAYAGLHLIYTRKGIEIEKYPAVYDHLLQHRDGLSQKKGANKWYELQASPSDRLDAEFAKDKLIWIELVESGRFAYDDSGKYGEATTFVMTGNSIKYLCSLLNSNLIRWYLQQIAPTSGMGTFRWKKVYVERIPIPRLAEAEQRPFVELVERILAAKASNPAAAVGGLEAELDGLVYALYGLTAGEVAAVAGG